MIKYLLLRIPIIWWIVFFTRWASFFKTQSEIFHELNMFSGWFMRNLIFLLILIIGLIIINIYFDILMYFKIDPTERKSNRERIFGNSFKKILENYTVNIFKKTLKNIEIGWSISKFQSLLMFLVFFNFPAIYERMGSPFVYNYIGIYKTYEGGYTRGGEDLINNSNLVLFNKNDTHKIKDWYHEQQDIEEDEGYEDTLERKFIFHQSGVMEGFMPTNHNFKIADYFSYLFYYFVETFLATIINYIFPITIFILLRSLYVKYN